MQANTFGSVCSSFFDGSTRLLTCSTSLIEVHSAMAGHKEQTSGSCLLLSITCHIPHTTAESIPRAAHISNAIHSYPRQSGSTLKHSGMSIFIVTPIWLPGETEDFAGVHRMLRTSTAIPGSLTDRESMRKIISNVKYLHEVDPHTDSRFHNNIRKPIQQHRPKASIISRKVLGKSQVPRIVDQRHHISPSVCLISSALTCSTSAALHYGVWAG